MAAEQNPSPNPVASKRSVILATIICLIAGIVYSTVTIRTHEANRFQTPLHKACFDGDLAAVRTLIAAGADVNAQGPLNDGDTPLMLVIPQDKNLLAIVDLLLAHGANPNLRDRVGRSALHVAALYDRTAVMEALIAHGADVNARDSEGHTPLSYVGPWSKDKPTKALLLKYGAK